MDTWIQVYTGSKLNPINPDINSIHIEDIAHALSQMPRFNGHGRVPYNIACHSIHVGSTVYHATQNKAYALVGLLHDASEALGLSDIPKPVKQYFPEYQQVENKLLGAVFAAFHISQKTVYLAWDEVKKADNIALITEFNALFDHPPIDNWTSAYDVEPDPNGIEILNHEDAKALFLYKYEQWSD